MSLIYPRDDAQSEFEYPENRLFKLLKILPAAKIRQPNDLGLDSDPVRFVIKNGHTTATTIGRLNRFESHKRQYSMLGTFDSVEAAVYPYDKDSGPFSRGGDSGATIFSADNEFIAQLTGGTGPTDSLDITYGASIEWVWYEVIKPKFPGAVLFFDDIPEN